MKLTRKLFCILFSVAVLAFSSIAFLACKEPEKATNVTYIVDGSIYASLKVEDGTEVQPTNPDKDLYKFEGWYTDNKHTEKFVFDDYAADPERSDVMVYAKFTFDGSVYTVTYDANGGVFANDKTTATVNVNEQSIITAQQADPVREGYEFSGWARNKSGTKLWYLNTDTVTENVTLYAVWARIFTVKYNANGGEFANGDDELDIDAANGSYLTVPEKPSRRGYIFDGWATQITATESNWDFDGDTVIADMTLYAVWTEEVDEYDVTFILNYDDKEEVHSTEKGLITYEAERSGYIFNGWWNFTKNDDGEYVLTTKYDTSVRVTKNNLSLCASWISEDSICKILSAPTVGVSNSVISWAPVEGATEYKIIIYTSGNSANPIISTTVSSTSYTFSSSYDYGMYYVQVKAIGDGYSVANSGYSAAKQFTHKELGEVACSFDITTSVFTVKTVTRANSYKFYIDGIHVNTYNRGFEYDMSDYDAGVYVIKLEISNSDTTKTATTTVRKLKLLEPQVNALYDTSARGYVLRWNEVAQADCYKVTIGESTKTVSNTSYTVASSNFSDSDEIVYSVAAFDSTHDYLISEAEEHTLGKPLSLNVNQNDYSAGRVVLANVYTKQSYTVTFNANGGSGAPSAQTVTSSSALSYPTAYPTRSGYIFTGWYTSADCRSLFDFTKTLYNDVTVYAGWMQMSTDNYSRAALSVGAMTGASNAKQYSSNYTSSSSNGYIYVTILNGGSYDFYYRNANTGNNYGIYICVTNETQNKTVKLNSVCTSTSYASVSFEANAGDIILIKYYRYNTSYSSSAYFYFTTEGSITPAAGATCTAEYKSGNTNANSVTTTSVIIEAGAEVILTASSYSGYIFEGWYDEDGELLSTEWAYKTTYSKSTTVTAKWKQ